jgi:hypothetical protein
VQLPGNAQLNTVGGSIPFALVCESGGNCAAGGDFENVVSNQIVLQPFVGSQSDGTWSSSALNGMSSLNTQGPGITRALACSSAGNCVAGGDYRSSTAGQQGFVVVETNGTWGTAQELPGVSALETGESSEVLAVGCAPSSTVSCAVGGYYTLGASGSQEAVVASVSGTTWKSAAALPGMTTLSGTNASDVSTIACGAVGNCVVAGTYYVSGHIPGFVDAMTSGTWGTAEEIPGLSTVSAAGSAAVPASSCTASGDCVIAGTYDPSSSVSPSSTYGASGFTDVESGGTWATLATAALPSNATGGAEITAMSCPATNDCVVVGAYNSNAAAGQEGFATAQTVSGWGTPSELSEFLTPNAVACWSAGNCVTVGSGATSPHYPPEMNTSAAGTWGTGFAVPGLTTLSTSTRNQVTNVACGADGSCTAMGYYYYNNNADQAVWESTFAGTPTLAVTSLSPSAGPVKGGNVVTISGTEFSKTAIVKFGTKVATGLHYVSADKLTVIAPANVGAQYVTVATSAGKTPTVAAAKYTYVVVPTITSVTPNKGSSKGGTTVTITGSGLSLASAVHFGAAAGSDLVIKGATKLTVKSPKGAGKVVVTVTTPGGKSSATTKTYFTYS